MPTEPPAAYVVFALLSGELTALRRMRQVGLRGSIEHTAKLTLLWLIFNLLPH
jgi:hypothetical protein